MVQKIETGGTSRTRTPIFRLRANALFDPIDARHMAHWAIADSDDNPHQAMTASAIKSERIIDLRLKSIPKF